MRLAFLLAVAAVVGACASYPAVHPRALEANDYCARYLSEGDLSRAEIQCDLGLQFSPQYSDLWVNKGLIAIKRNQVEVAKEHLIKALRFNQEQAQAYNNLGFIYYKEQKYGKAHDMFQRALKVNPDYTEARYNLGLAFMGLKKKKEARKEFRTIIAINERLADPHHQLGVLALEDGELDEAIDETRRAVELDPGYGDAWMNLGNAYATAGRAQEAKDAFTSCLEVDPNNAQCRHNLALSAQKAALMNPALKDAERSVEFAGGAPERFELARQYGEKGLLAEKERQLRKCVEADGKYTPCHFGLFQIFKEDGRQREARIACKNVLKFASTDEFPNEISQCDKFLSLQP